MMPWPLERHRPAKPKLWVRVPPVSLIEFGNEAETDSERILYLLLDRMNDRYEKNGYPPDVSARFRAVDDLICEIADGNKRNLLFFDGEYLYVHTNCRDSLFLSKLPGGYVFSTVPLDKQEWRPLLLNRLLAFQDGKLVLTGTDHGYEYVEDPEKMYLSDKYGRYRMTFSGIHVNFSFSEELLRRSFRLDGGDSFQKYKDTLYLKKGYCNPTGFRRWVKVAKSGGLCYAYIMEIKKQAIHRKPRIGKRWHLMLKAYKYRIYPNKEQKVQIAKTFGCCRFVYNQTLAYRKDA